MYPVCGANMVKNSVSVKGDVIIDECYSCGAKFFDHGELTKMREEYPTEEDRRQALLTETYNEIGAKIDDLELKNNMNLEGGVLVTVPVPKEFAMDEKIINSAINDAQKEMEEKGIKGKDETPFLLKKINEITEGKSLETNIYLIKNNAKIGAKIAVEYSKLIKGE